MNKSSLESGILANLHYYLKNDDLEGLASDLSIIISNNICDDDVADDVANSLHLKVLENVALDGDTEEN